MRLPRLLAAPLMLLAASAARADDTADFLKADNWEGLKGHWTVDGTTVTGTTDKDLGFNTFLASKKKYGDFELSFKVRLKDGKGNSGVQVRSAVIGAEKFVVAGPQADIGDVFWGSLYGEKVGGYLKKAPKNHAKAAEFNDYKVAVKGSKITIAVNGETTYDGEMPNDPKFPLPADGVIAFQLHSGGPMTVTFKDIKFTDLSKK